MFNLVRNRQTVFQQGRPPVPRRQAWMRAAVAQCCHRHSAWSALRGGVQGQLGAFEFASPQWPTSWVGGPCVSSSDEPFGSSVHVYLVCRLLLSCRGLDGLGYRPSVRYTPRGVFSWVLAPFPGSFKVSLASGRLGFYWSLIDPCCPVRLLFSAPHGCRLRCGSSADTAFPLRSPCSGVRAQVSTLRCPHCPSHCFCVCCFLFQITTHALGRRASKREQDLVGRMPAARAWLSSGVGQGGKGK